MAGSGAEFSTHAPTRSGRLLPRITTGTRCPRIIGAHVDGARDWPRSRRSHILLSSSTTAAGTAFVHHLTQSQAGQAAPAPHAYAIGTAAASQKHPPLPTQRSGFPDARYNT
ncbi:hypothetical protein Tchl_0771 [Thauera chlorobenzoica]|uniref:Uncharacterized protein n=1 Tax=Thauera chlorobenzoica TaxID=96773 RepID=A0A1L6F9P0_9RHOO|nr:hypothetical protein Tchl_0771 [Thauera chlorobenzoica]